MPQFPMDDLERVVPDSAKLAMAEVILSWATFDSLVSQWTILAFGMSFDVGAIFVGNMDTKSKLDKLCILYEHVGLSGLKTVKALRKQHGDHVNVRNAIAHSSCVGRLKSDPQRIVFSPFKAVKGEVGTMEIAAIHIEQFRAAAEFAVHMIGQINPVVERLLSLREGQSEA